MPKKDTTAAVLGMLSSVGAQTQPTTTPVDPTETETRARGVEPEWTQSDSVGTIVDGGQPVVVDQLPPGPVKRRADQAPRTLRLQPGTASELRAAWLEAKRDDVLLTAQDFASTLVNEALAARRRRTRTASAR